MSKLYDGPDYENNWLALGCAVWFDGPDGDRLCGEIVRTSSNPSYFHIWANGQRYEVDLNQDRMSKEKEPTNANL
jgi:hypothetical protein